MVPPSRLNAPRSGAILRNFDEVVVAAGARTPQLLPHLQAFLRPLAQPVVHFQVPREQLDALRDMPVYAASIRTTGFYGFPPHPITGHCKVGYHGPGYALPPGAVTQEVLSALAKHTRDLDEPRFRAFVRELLPALNDAPHTEHKMCMYVDSLDADFVIDRDVQFRNVVVASGGSGHGFKFMPVLGSLIADALEGRTAGAELLEAQRRFARLAERMANTHAQLYDTCRAAGDARENQQRQEALQRALSEAGFVQAAL